MDVQRGLQRGLRLEYLTLGWNIVGSIVVIGAAIVAHSVALAGFGLDSLIEIFASVVVVWHLTGGATQQSERRALRLIGSGFIVLAIYILLQSVYSLATQTEPHRSWVGIAWLAATFVVMLLLALGKRTIGQRINNAVLITEARVTFIDAYLAGAILIGLLLNAAFDWWWADPLAALIIVYYGIVEGRAAYREGSSVTS